MLITPGLLLACQSPLAQYEKRKAHFSRPSPDNIQVSFNRGDTSSAIIDSNDPLFSVIDVRSLGAVGDGKTDDTEAFIRAISQAEQRVSETEASYVSNFRGNVKIEVPPGEYLITRPEALMRSSFTKRTVGLTIEGAGRGVSRVLFHPATPGGFLLENNDAWLHVKIAGIEFNSNDVDNSFMHSYSNGGAQNYVFSEVNWTGKWKNGFLFEGSNNNSEMLWNHCGFYGIWEKVLYAPAGTSSDQFLNYNFYSTQCEIQSGDFIHFEKGGNISVWGGSFIHSGSGGGTFFKLNTGSHAYGVQRFLCIGARFEQRNPSSLLCDIAWNDGNVSFINCDMAGSTHLLPPSTITAKFTSLNQKMSSIKFDNCSLLGRHQYIYGNSSWSKPHNVSYDNCEITGFNTPNDFILLTAEGGHSNLGGAPVIKFENCRGVSDNQKHVWDTALNLHKSTTGVGQKKILSLKNASGRFPIAGQKVTVQLPLGSIITKVYLYAPQGVVTSGNAANFRLETSETSPTILANIFSSPHRNGFELIRETVFICDTEQKREISLVAGPEVDQYNGGAICIIEYI